METLVGAEAAHLLSVKTQDLTYRVREAFAITRALDFLLPQTGNSSRLRPFVVRVERSRPRSPNSNRILRTSPLTEVPFVCCPSS